MALRTILFWPVYRTADWTDRNPVSTAGFIIAIGALSVLFAQIALGMGIENEALALDAGTAGFLVEIALERPAYPAVALIGIAATLFYNG